MTVIPLSKTLNAQYLLPDEPLGFSPRNQAMIAGNRMNNANACATAKELVAVAGAYWCSR